MDGSVIEVRHLSVYYGSHRGVLDLDLTVPRAEVFGFLGPNGAGKTTTMRVLLDVIRPTRGSARIFGLDCQRNGPEIRRRVGYVPGELSIYQDMSGRQYLDLVQSLRRNGGHVDYRAEICERLDLDTSRRVKEYSTGNKQKLGLVAALMDKPELLILDEPTAGLDPLVQRVVLDLVREARSEGRTVFFSSHNLPEVEAVCDSVGIVREGRLVACDRLEKLTVHTFHRIKFGFSKQPPTESFLIPGVRQLECENGCVRLEVRENMPRLLQNLAPYGICDLETQQVTLDEVFAAYFSGEAGDVS